VRRERGGITHTEREQEREKIKKAGGGAPNPPNRTSGPPPGGTETPPPHPPKVLDEFALSLNLISKERGSKNRDDRISMREGNHRSGWWQEGKNLEDVSAAQFNLETTRGEKGVSEKLRETLCYAP